MKTPRILLLPLLAIVVMYSNVSAQHSIGATVSTHITAPNVYPTPVYAGLADWGASAYVIYRENLSDWAFAGGELGYSQDKMYLPFPFFVNTFNDFLVDVDYWRMAIIAGLKYGIGPVNFRIGVGPSLGYLARHKIRPAIEQEEDVVYDRPSTVDVALIGGGEIGVTVSSNLELFVGMRYDRSISYIWSKTLDADPPGQTRDAYLWLGSQHFQFGFLVDI